MNEQSLLFGLLAGAMLLDALLGEPGWLWSRVPHPVTLAGRVIDWLDRRMNDPADSPRQRRIAGIFAIGLPVLGVAVIGTVLEHLPFAPVLGCAIAAVLLAQRSLGDHVAAVAEGLSRDLESGREAVAKIVGRDPQSLDEAGVARAAIESAAENFSDGVVAPAFWFIVGGIPGLLVYKLVNTADSMIGHRTARHGAFGWAAARLDDVLNIVPARLSVLLIAAAAWSKPALQAAWADAPKHRSPNAGWPEAAMAGALGLALAGPRRYAGTLVDDHWMNRDGRQAATAADIHAAHRLIWRAWAAGLAVAVVLAVVL